MTAVPGLWGESPGTYWRILNISDEGGSRPVASAAPLLFQAPQFVAPAPTPVKNEEAPRKRQPAKKAPAKAGSSEPDGDEKATAKEQKSTRNEASGLPTRKRTRNQSSSSDKDKGANEQPRDAEDQKPGKQKSTSQDDSDNAQHSGEKSDLGAKDKSSASQQDSETSEGEGSSRRRRRRTRPSSANRSSESADPQDQVKALRGSTRLEAKRLRRREGRREGRRRQSITEAEFLARRESVDRQMVVRHENGLDQIAVLEDNLLVEHYVARRTQQSIVGNIYLGRVQNVLPSMEAAFIDIGRGRNGVLYAGEVNWDSLGMEGKPQRIEQALKSGDTVLVQVTKDPIGHKGARLTSQITLAGRYLVLVPGSTMLGISRKLPDNERQRLKKILKEAVPADTGVIVRTAAEGATEEQLRGDIDRLQKQLKEIERKHAGTRKAPQLLRGEPELAVRVVRDIFNEDFNELVIQGNEAWTTISEYVEELSPELTPRLEKWTSKEDVFHAKRIDQQLAKGMDRKVWLPSGGTLVIDRTEALTVVDVNTGKFIGSGGTLEETITRNNLEAAEELVRQLRLRDIGGIIIIDFVDMVLESNRELVLRRLIECLGRDRTRHQVTEITSLGLVQMTRKRVGEGLVEAFSTTCEQCEGRGFIVHDRPVEIEIETPRGQRQRGRQKDESKSGGSKAKGASQGSGESGQATDDPVSHVGEEKVKTALNAIAAATVTEADVTKTATPKGTANKKPAAKSKGKAASSSEQDNKPKAAERMSGDEGEKAGAKESGTAAPRRRRVISAKASAPAPAKPLEKQPTTRAASAVRDVADIALPDVSEVEAKRVPRRRRITSSDKVTPRRSRSDRGADAETSSASANEAVRSLLES